MIKIQGLTKRYGSIEAVVDVSFEIASGEAVIIHGPSGSGKTTLLRLLAGLEMPDEGRICIDGEIASTPDWVLPPYQRGIGIVFQRNALWPHMTVAKNIRFVMDGIPKSEKAERLRLIIQEVCLDNLSNRYPSQLSSGEARRVALARAIADKPQRLLLDEPLINLDPELKSQLLKVIQDYAHHEKATLLFVTHDLDKMEYIADKLVGMKEGRVYVVRKD